jgi:hypothetical protein
MACDSMLRCSGALQGGVHGTKPLHGGASSKLPLQFLVDVAIVLSFISSSILQLFLEDVCW